MYSISLITQLYKYFQIYFINKLSLCELEISNTNYLIVLNNNLNRFFFLNNEAISFSTT